MAARLGLLARDLRQAAAQSHGRQAQIPHAERVGWRQRVEQFRSNLRKMWDSHTPRFSAMGYSNEHVAVHDRGIFEHVSQHFYFSALPTPYVYSIPCKQHGVIQLFWYIYLDTVDI